MNSSRYFLAFVFASFASAAFAQQMPAYSEAGPVPPAISHAKNIFVSNGGSDSGLFPETLPFSSSLLSQPFTGDAGRPYTRFYAALQATKQYTLVTDPNQADIVLELRLTAPYGPSNPNRQNGASDPLPQFRLVAYDAKSHYVLWTFTESIEPAFLQKTHDKNFDKALAALITQFLFLAHRPPAVSIPAQ
jgi:hypothetical protein